MKKIIYLISLVISSVLYTSCDALDLAPEDYFGSGNFWHTKAQVDGFMKGMHGELRDNYQMFYTMGELRGGTQRIGNSSLNTSLNFTIPRTNALSQDNPGFNNWFGVYAHILQVNLFIQEVENGCAFLSEADRQVYLGQAYGLRALYYFMLYKTYGGVPIVTKVELLDGKVTAAKFYVERGTPEATMAFIKEDIGKSENYLGVGEVPGRYDKTMWSKAATLMLKAEVYLWAAKVSINGYTATGRTDLETAKAALNGVIGKFQLLDNYGDIFKTSNRNNAEVIFTLHFADGEAGNWAGEFLYRDDTFNGQVYGRDGRKIEGDTLNLRGKGGVFRNEYTEDFWKSYDETDTRRDATFMDYYSKADKTGFGCVMLKGIGSINSTNNRVFDTDIIVYRYADALLMMAEIENGLGNSCASYINEVRKRAYGDDFDANMYTEGAYAENELAILHERDKEFVWEGKRWFDVVRMHDAAGKSLALSPTGNYPSDTPLLGQSEEYKLLWPIDITVMSNNPQLKQTPGYE